MASRISSPSHRAGHAAARAHGAGPSHAARTTRGRTRRSRDASPRIAASSAASSRRRVVQPPVDGGSGRGGRRRRRGHGRRRHSLLGWIGIVLGSVLGLAVAAVVAFVAYLWITTDIPQPEKFALAQKTTVTYADGTTPIGTFADQNREIVDCAVLPAHVGQAVVASEDRTFYTNRGIDLRGTARALLSNLTRGTRQGGSTITQQYAERYYSTGNTTYLAKAREAVLALKIAQSQDKGEVLCNYMNTIYLGRGAYGIQAAAQAYFGKDAKDLTVDESALLAGIIPAPSTWDPATNPKQARQRFNRVIDIMAEDGYITAKQKAEASMPATVDPTVTNTYQGPNGYLLQMVRRELTRSKAFTEDDLDTGGYRIVTTIQPDKQELMRRVSSRQGGNADLPEGVQAGSISVNVRDGSIIALYAGDDYLAKPLNNVTDATYEVGSTMKPFALLAAIEDDVSLSTRFNGNSPRSFPGLSQPMTNSGGVSYGPIDLYRATANSVNTVYMDLAERVGSDQIVKTAQKAGVTGTINDDAYTVLGNSGLSVEAMATGFATIANQGARPTLHLVAQVLDPNGRDLYHAPTQPERVFDANDANLAVKAMEGTIQYGTGKEARSVGRTMAGKSGTANDSKAVSFVGFTPSTLSLFALWNPGPNGEALEMPDIAGYSRGMSYPAHMFTMYMKEALANEADQAFPDATDNGKLGGPDGTWGLGGSGKSAAEMQQEAQQRRQAQAEAQQRAREEARQRFQEECAADPQSSSSCPGYVAPTQPTEPETGDAPSSGGGTGGTGGAEGAGGATGGTGTGGQTSPQTGDGVGAE